MLTPDPGAPEAAERAGRLGYDRIVVAPQGGVNAKVLEAELARALQHPTWLAGHFARAFVREHPDVVRALTTATLGLPSLRTVTTWADALGLSRQDLHALFRKHELPSPKWILDRLRLAAAARWAAEMPSAPTRNQVARAFRYASGDYLGRHASKLTGRSFGDLTRMGFADALGSVLRS